MTSTFPPVIRKLNLSLEDIHLCTAIPLDLLEGYEQGRFKPAPREHDVLNRFAAVLDSYPTPLTLALFLDRRRFRLLRTVIPRAEIERTLENGVYADYHRALCELCEVHAEAFEKAIAADVKKAKHYDPASR